MTMQDDGNCVIHAKVGQHLDGEPTFEVLWASHVTGPIGSYFLSMANDGNMHIFPGVRGRRVL